MTETTTYPGHAFHASFKNGRASGQISISASGVRFTNDSASVQLPLHGLQCSLGGASDRLIFLSHASEPAWKLYTSERALLNDPHLQQLPSIRAQLQKAKQKHVMNWGVFAVVALLIIALPALLLFNMDGLSGRLARHVPVEWEQQLGDQVFKQYKVDSHFMDQKQADALLQPLVQPLLDANPDKRFEYRIHINRDEEVNAFALPGGYVVINTGLIIRAETPEELLGVVAHEIAHVTEQHGVRNIIGTAGIYLTVNALLGDMTGLLALIADAAPFLINQSYSRGFETEADEKGVALLERANINPGGLTSFFEKLREEEEKRLKEMAGDDNQDLAKATLSIVSTHPATEDRIAHLEKITQPKPGQRYRDLDEPFLHLQDAVKQFVTNSAQE